MVDGRKKVVANQVFAIISERLEEKKLKNQPN